MNYASAVKFLDSFVNYEKTDLYDYPEAFKLDRMRALAKELGNPQNAYECVLIAGSKGKGSTAAILSSILRMENYRVGLYTSPHLVDIRERIQINGIPIGEARFVEGLLLIRRTLDTPAWRKNPPTYFEMLTAMAFHHFREMKAHVAVLEVGLGGLYDSTNIASAKAVGLTPINLEHTEKLGKTVSKIALQKCGVIKEREVVVSAPQMPEAEAVIQRKTLEQEATLLRVGKEIRVFPRDCGERFQKFDLRAPFGSYFELETHLLGAHQMDNAAVAIGLANGLERKTRLKVSQRAVRQGVLDASWPGRLEVVSDHPTVIFDGAHNPESMKAALEGVKRHFQFRRLIVILGISKDKDLTGILSELLPEAYLLVATQSTAPRAFPAKSIALGVENFNGDVIIEGDAPAALKKGLLSAGPGDLVLVIGSLYLVGDLKARIEEIRTVLKW